MFTGLIETTGTVLALKTTKGSAQRLIIAAPELAGRWKIGDSIAVNGVCLTAVDMEDTYEAHPGRFAADLAAETIERTTLTSLQPGALVNLELPTPSGSPMGGHVVQGHVDAVAIMTRMHPLNDDLDRTDWRMSLRLPESLLPYVISQGSITIDGISLTVAKVEGDCIEVAVIPHTYRATNLHALPAGSLVNIETDTLGRYAAHQRTFATEKLQPLTPLPVTLPESSAVVPDEGSGEWLTTQYLIANGY